MPKKFNGLAAEILLVEDNIGDAKLTFEAFSQGCINNNLSHVHDGVEAMAYLRREPPYEEAIRPDIILLDLNMPRKNGCEVLEEIKQDQNLKSIPVIMLTTSDAERDVALSYELQASCFVNKPVDLDDFLGVIRQIESFWLMVVKLPENS